METTGSFFRLVMFALPHAVVAAVAFVYLARRYRTSLLLIGIASGIWFCTSLFYQLAPELGDVDGLSFEIVGALSGLTNILFVIGLVMLVMEVDKLARGADGYPPIPPGTIDQ
jgi:hypothetical protein